MNISSLNFIDDSQLESACGGSAWLLLAHIAYEIYPYAMEQYSKPGGEGRIPASYRR